MFVFPIVSRLLAGGRFLASIAIIAGLLLASTLSTFAAGGQTGNVSGTVLDAATKAPIAGASVTLASPSGTFNGKTNGAGFFTILGLQVDTYTLSVQAGGYDIASQTGVTIQGDQTLNLGSVNLSKALRTIGRVTTRGASGAFQPSQTIDSYTISGARITQTTGKEATTNENNLLLAVPGVTLTNAQLPTIRGGAAREVGYQLDGVTFTEPFLGNNGSNGLFNGVGSVQVVEGAGDATQGNVGSGVINLIPKRGAYPGFGYVDAETGGPNFNRQFAFEYGIATRDGHISNYVTFNQNNFVPYNGATGGGNNGSLNAGPYLGYFSGSYTQNTQLTDNFVFKFGHNNNQQLQVLYNNISSLQYGNLGGLPSGVFNPYGTDSAPLTYYPYDTLTQNGWAGAAGYSTAQYANLIGLAPGVALANVPITTPQLNTSTQTGFLKFEYDNNISPTTYLALRYYNWSQLQGTDNDYSLGPSNSLGGFAISDQSIVGGSTVGGTLDITHQFGSKLTVTLNGKYDVAHPVWNAYEPQLQVDGLLGSTSDAACVNVSLGCPSTADWLKNGYVYNYFGGNVPRIPTWGIGYNRATFDNWGTGLRFQYNPVQAVKFDLGVRYEGQNQHFVNQLDQYGQGPPTDPFDVGATAWSSKTLHPKEWEPRAGATIQLDPNDSVRLGYGRSAVFDNAQTSGTPFNLYNIQPYLNVPAQKGFMCGISAHQLFPCRSYGEELYWAGDQVEAPDAGNTVPAIYSNYDISFSHQFKNGWGARVTPFYKLGTDLPSFALIAILPGNNDIFGAANFGFNRTTGVEFNLTTPEHPVGFSGFLSATYQNVLSTTPPLSINETNVPLLSTATLQLGDLYRAGYVSPVSFRVGGTYNTKSGFSVTPVLQYDLGYPYSIGNLIAATVGTNQYANIPQVNFGPGVNPLTGIEAISGVPLSTNYYDPSDPGTALHPNIAATRGTQATSANGGYLSAANLQANVTFQYKRAGNTFGIQLANLFGNAFIGAVPTVNPFYQPVATGLSGPQTNHNTCSLQFGTTRGCANIPNEINAFTNGAYLLSNGNFTGATGLAPLNPFSVNVYYQHAL